MNSTGMKRVSCLNGCHPTSCMVGKAPATQSQGEPATEPCMPANDFGASHSANGGGSCGNGGRDGMESVANSHRGIGIDPAEIENRRHQAHLTDQHSLAQAMLDLAWSAQQAKELRAAAAAARHADRLDVILPDGAQERDALSVLESLSGFAAVSELTIKAALLELTRLEAKVKAMLEERVHLERLAFEDILTGLPNRRRLERTVLGGLAEMSSSGAPVSVAFVDVDRFKQINDTFSHAVGDRVLVAIAGLLSRHIRAVDTACRWAGDEFVIIFGRADRRVAQRAWARVARAIADFDWSDIAPGLSVTVSAGIATARTGDDLSTLLTRSDGAMYAAKRRGVPVR